MMCPNCKIEMLFNRVYMTFDDEAFENSCGTDVNVYMCIKCAYSEAETV